jgi:soluble lytic murein transglycosylase
MQGPGETDYAGNQSVADDSWYLGEQRKAFLQAEAALHKGQGRRYRLLKDALLDYPLYPYLEYAELRGRLGHADATEVKAFLQRYADTPLARRIRGAWLDKLAARGSWEQFADAYTHSERVTRRCQWLRALINTGEVEAAFDKVDELWLVGHSQPPDCDPVFAAWRADNRLTRELTWKRIELAMVSGRPSLASYLARYLEPDERRLVDTWRQVRRDPNGVLDAASLDGDREIVESVLVYGMTRLARRDPENAVLVWETLRSRFDFSESSIAAVHRRIGLAFAYRHRPESLYWLNAIPEDRMDERAREWRILSALRQREWQRALEHILEMEAGKGDSERWRYWSARSLEALGWHEDAETLYGRLATRRSYYGFLAADRLELDYNLAHRALAYDQRMLRLLAAQPAAMRARELFHLHRLTEARREWRLFIAEMEDEQLARAAKLAQRWGWHGRAIMTVARTPFLDDLEMRFPLAYRDGVMEQAEAKDLDPAWVYAIVRQESAFVPDARSPAGALGLMQIMPGTGRTIGRSLNKPLTNPRQLLETQTSLQFGSTYLRTLLDDLDNHPVLAAAAYNAGPHRVERWRPHDQNLSADVWIENIPYRETREYLRRVLAYTTIYEQRLGREPARLSDRLAPIPRRASRLARVEAAPVSN